MRTRVVRGLKIDTTYKFASRVGTYVAMYPVVQSLAPHYGLVTGNTKVSVTGIRLRDVERVTVGAKDCKFDDPTDPYTTLTVYTPGRSRAGSWDVVVHTKDGLVGVCLCKFTYIDVPTDEKAAVAPPMLKIDASSNLKTKRAKGFRAVRAVLITAMTDRNLILHSDFAPDDKTERTLAILRKLLQAQRGRIHLESVHVDNARKLTKPYVLRSSYDPASPLCSSLLLI
jgi:hypothetical protein